MLGQSGEGRGGGGGGGGDGSLEKVGGGRDGSLGKVGGGGGGDGSLGHFKPSTRNRVNVHWNQCTPKTRHNFNL